MIGTFNNIQTIYVTISFVAINYHWCIEPYSNNICGDIVCRNNPNPSSTRFLESLCSLKRWNSVFQSTFLLFFCLIIVMESDINANVRYMKYTMLQEWKCRRSNCKLLKRRVKMWLWRRKLINVTWEWWDMFERTILA